MSSIREALRRYEEARTQLLTEVQAARRTSLTWAEIGSELGITRQAAAQRFGRRPSPLETPAALEARSPESRIRYIDVVQPKSTQAAVVVRSARTEAAMSQSTLSGRSGLPQSVISAYESGKRDPSLTQVAGLVEAAGFDLVIGLTPHDDGLADRLTGPLGHRVRQYRRAMIRTVEAHGMSNLRIFGSVARGEETAESDVDLLVDVAPGIGLFALGRLRSVLEGILEADVDLVPSEGLKDGVRENVARDLVAL